MIALKDGYQTFWDLIYRVEVVVIHIGLQGELARLQLADGSNYQTESDFELCRGLHFRIEAALPLDC